MERQKAFKKAPKRHLKSFQKYIPERSPLGGIPVGPKGCKKFPFYARVVNTIAFMMAKQKMETSEDSNKSERTGGGFSHTPLKNNTVCIQWKFLRHHCPVGHIPRLQCPTVIDNVLDVLTGKFDILVCFGIHSDGLVDVLHRFVGLHAKQQSAHHLLSCTRRGGVVVPLI